MKRITMTFEDDMYSYLQERAKSNRRRPSGELNSILYELKNNKMTLNQLQNAGITNFKITPPKTEEELEDERINAFQKLAKQILGQELNISECNLGPDNRYYEFAPEREGKFLRWAYDMPLEKQKEYINEWKNYL